MEMKIRRTKEDELNQVLEVLNAAAIELKNKGINQWSYPWEPEIIKDELKHSFVLFIDNKIVGTFFISSIDILSDLNITKGSAYLHKNIS